MRYRTWTLSFSSLCSGTCFTCWRYVRLWPTLPTLVALKMVIKGAKALRNSAQHCPGSAFSNHRQSSTVSLTSSPLHTSFIVCPPFAINSCLSLRACCITGFLAHYPRNRKLRSCCAGFFRLASSFLDTSDDLAIHHVWATLRPIHPVGFQRPGAWKPADCCVTSREFVPMLSILRLVSQATVS